MLGRHRQEGLLAHVDRGKAVRVGLAVSLVVAATGMEYLAQPAPWVVPALCLASLSLTGFPIIWEALRGLLSWRTNVDELVSIAIVASLVLGEWISAATVACIMVVGSLVEELTSERARRHLERLTSMSPRQALVLTEEGNVRSVSVEELRPGHTILTRPGDVIAADGEVIAGESEVDESMLTGEALPAAKRHSDAVAAGTVNLSGSLQIRVLRVGSESAQGRIQALIQEAEKHRAPLLRVAESYARWFTPAILLLAGAVWFATGDVHRAVTMLIVGCPCAFVLATPTAVVAALGCASKHGVLIKGGKYLEACAKVRTVAFDKTGTLTTGSMTVQQVCPAPGVGEQQLLQEAARLETQAEHPVAKALTRAAAERAISVGEGLSVRLLPGLGVREVTEGEISPLVAGTAALMEQASVVVPAEVLRQAAQWSREGLVPVFVGRGEIFRGVLALADTLRDEAPSVIGQLRSMGLERFLLLTGDDAVAAQRVASQLGLPAESVHARQLPEDKYGRLHELEQRGESVCYVGDGTNDGPALAVASVGVSIGSRENTVALETADAVLMHAGLARLPFLLRLGRATARTINQNLFLFGLLFNATMLVLSASGCLTPVLGALGHNLGSVAVVLNSARLLRTSPAPVTKPSGSSLSVRQAVVPTS